MCLYCIACIYIYIYKGHTHFSPPPPRAHTYTHIYILFSLSLDFACVLPRAATPLSFLCSRHRLLAVLFIDSRRRRRSYNSIFNQKRKKEKGRSCAIQQRASSLTLRPTLLIKHARSRAPFFASLVRAQWALRSEIYTEKEHAFFSATN